MRTFPGFFIRYAAMRLAMPCKIAGSAVSFPTFAADVIVLLGVRVAGRASTCRTRTAVGGRSYDGCRLLHKLANDCHEGGCGVLAWPEDAIG